MLLQIKPGLRTVWRDDGSVQIGLDAGRGTVLEGLDQGDRAVIERLAAGLDEGELAAAGGADALPDPHRARALVRLLAGTGVLVDRRSGRDVLARVGPAAARLSSDAAVWSVVHPEAGDGWELLAARAERTVEVRGAGRTGSALVATLTAAGIGRVDLVDPRPVAPADVGPAAARWADVGRRADTVARRLQRELRPAPAHPSSSAPPGPDAPDLTVLVRGAAADSAEAAELVRAGLPHLAVVVRERGVLVGPLVLPGRGPCLRCLDLHRADRDPAWPRVLAQLTARGGRAARASEESASALLAASLAALQVLRHLDGGGRPAALGATLEVELPDGLVSRRPWSPHPACGCASSLLEGDTGSHRGRSGPPEGTMAG